MTTQPTTKAAHTPTPWKRSGRDIFSGCAYLADVKANARVTPEESEANAAFIVRACNSYESDQRKIAALVEALNTLDEVRGAIMLAEVEGGSSELAYDVERVVAQARAALSRAQHPAQAGQAEGQS